MFSTFSWQPPNKPTLSIFNQFSNYLPGSVSTISSIIDIIDTVFSGSIFCFNHKWHSSSCCLYISPCNSFCLKNSSLLYFFVLLYPRPYSFPCWIPSKSSTVLSSFMFLPSHLVVLSTLFISGTASLTASPSAVLCPYTVGLSHVTSNSDSCLFLYFSHGS